MLKRQLKARKKGLSMSRTVRRLLRKVLSEDDGSVDEALDAEMIMESHARDTRTLASRLVKLLAWLLYDTGQIKALANNTLGLQKGMTEQMHKDILTDANRQTSARFSRQNPDLADFMDAIEKWLIAGEEEGRGGRNV